MQLKRVYANKPSFRTVEFHPTGLNFIVAKQKDASSTEKGKTYNGVGKSLLVTIIHFCLGSRKEKDFCEKLHDWEFSLDFKIGTQEYTSRRIVSKADKILLNDREYTQKKFCEKMQSLCFTIPEDASFLSFRSLLPFFIRPDRDSYKSYDKPIAKAPPYQVLLYNSFLLGLDEQLVQKKKKMQDENDKLKSQAKGFQENLVLRDFFTKNKDVKLRLLTLDELISDMEEKLRNYQVAEDYYETQKKADELEKERFALSNEILLLQNHIEKIEKSLSMSPDLDKAHIEKIYKEANIVFSERVKQELSDVEIFYKELIKNRKKRLTEQKNNISKEKELKGKQEARLGKELDKLMRYLGEHGALDTFVSLTEKNAKHKEERERLIAYQELEEQYKNKRDQLEGDFLAFKQETKTYLKESEKHVDKLLSSFREFAAKFYPNSSAGITIDSNDGDNQACFKIEAKIEADRSDGINNVKIFCYDLVLLFNPFDRHKINLIFHDSRLFDGIDARQKTEIFRVVYDSFHQSKKQYIATVNQNQLEEIKDRLSSEDYVNIVENNTILTLTDESEKEKLLGIKVEL